MPVKSIVVPAVRDRPGKVSTAVKLAAAGLRAR